MAPVGEFTRFVTQNDALITMDKLTISKVEIINQCRLHRQRPLDKRSIHDQRYVVIKDGNGVIQCGVKMGSVLDAEILQGELDWMIHLENHFKSDLVRIVKGYCIVEDGFWRLLVKEHLQGQLMWDVIGQGDTALSEADADMIAMAIVGTARTSWTLQQSPSFQTYTKYELVSPRFHLFLRQRWRPLDRGYCGLRQIHDQSLREGRDQHRHHLSNSAGVHFRRRLPIQHGETTRRWSGITRLSNDILRASMVGRVRPSRVK